MILKPNQLFLKLTLVQEMKLFPCNKAELPEMKGTKLQQLHLKQLEKVFLNLKI